MKMLRNTKALYVSCVYTTRLKQPQQIINNKLQSCCHIANDYRNKNTNSILFPNCLKYLKHSNSPSCSNYSTFTNTNVSHSLKVFVSSRYSNVEFLRCSSSSSNESDKKFNYKAKCENNYSFTTQNLPKIINSYKCKLDPYSKLMRVDKPIGTWLLFWPGAWSILLASSPSVCSLSTTLHTLALFLAGAFVMRGAGCTINDMWDKDIDAKVERTKDRPLVSGKITQKQALVFLAGQLSIGLSILLHFNWYTVALGASSLLPVVLYPLAKRVTYYPQLVLGFCFNWGALVGWTAIQGSIAPACLALYAAGVSWTLFYDTIYAHQDKRDDAIIGIKSTALKFGDSTKGYLIAFTTTFIASLTAAGIACDLQWPYYLVIGMATTHTAKQIATLDINNPKDCAEKFVSNHHVGLLIFLAVLIGKWETWLEYLNIDKAQKQFSNLDNINTLA